jgi:hypothetical protein
MGKIEERVFFPPLCVGWRKGEIKKRKTEGTAGAALEIWGMRKLRKAETREKGRVKDGRFFGGGGLFGEAHNRLSGSLYPFLDLGSAGRSVETWPGRGCLRKREKRRGKK